MIFEDLRVVCLPTSIGVHRAVYAVSQQANVLRSDSFSTCKWIDRGFCDLRFGDGFRARFFLCCFVGSAWFGWRVWFGIFQFGLYFPACQLAGWRLDTAPQCRVHTGVGHLVMGFTSVSVPLSVWGEQMLGS